MVLWLILECSRNPYLAYISWRQTRWNTCAEHDYLPTCNSRLVVQHLYQVSFKSMQGCRRSWEDKRWWDGMTDKANTSYPHAILGGGMKITVRFCSPVLGGNWIDMMAHKTWCRLCFSHVLSISSHIHASESSSDPKIFKYIWIMHFMEYKFSQDGQNSWHMRTFFVYNFCPFLLPKDHIQEKFHHYFYHFL